MTLREEIIKWSALADRLREMYPDLAADDPALITTLEGESNLTEALGHLVRSSELDRTMAAALTIRVDEMEQRRQRIESTMERKRELVAKVMENCGIKRIAQCDFTAVLTAGQPKVIVTNEKEIPGYLMVVPEPPPPKPDKRAIAGLLKAGAIVPGAVLSNAQPHITVRRD